MQVSKINSTNISFGNIGRVNPKITKINTPTSVLNFTPNMSLKDKIITIMYKVFEISNNEKFQKLRYMIFGC